MSNTYEETLKILEDYRVRTRKKDNLINHLYFDKALYPNELIENPDTCPEHYDLPYYCDRMDCCRSLIFKLQEAWEISTHSYGNVIEANDDNAKCWQAILVNEFGKDAFADVGISIEEAIVNVALRAKNIETDGQGE